MTAPWHCQQVLGNLPCTRQAQGIVVFLHGLPASTVLSGVLGVPTSGVSVL